MATTADRSVTINFNGDYDADNTFSATRNASSPGQSEIKTLASGNNTITVPTSATTVETAPTACTIIPPVGNTNAIILKGVNGDTGIQLHNTDPTSIAIDDSVTSFVLNAAAEIVGLRLIWS